MKRETLHLSQAVYRLVDHDLALHNTAARLILTHPWRLDPTISSYYTIRGDYGIQIDWIAPSPVTVQAYAALNGVLLNIESPQSTSVTEIMRNADEATDLLYDYFLRLTTAPATR